jgi:hypothetical protein
MVAIDPNGVDDIGHIDEHLLDSPFSPKFVVIPSTMRASCNKVLCLFRNSICSHQSALGYFT